MRKKNQQIKILVSFILGISIFLFGFIFLNGGSFSVSAAGVTGDAPGGDLVIDGVTLTKTAGTYNYNSITIKNGGTLTHNAEGSGTAGLVINVAGGVTLTNGKIDVSDKGYSGSVSNRYLYTGPRYLNVVCANGDGPGGGLCTPSSNVGANDIRGTKGGGGSYGGIGGPNNFSSPGPTSSSTYGDSNNPLDLGSGGGGGSDLSTATYDFDGNEHRTDCPISSSRGGNGGGAIALHVSGTLSIDAASFIRANGGDAVASGIAGSGGGSGGSINIEAGTIKLNKQTGYFPFQAVGGKGSQGGSICGLGFSLDGSGGGGGRVAVATGGFLNLSNQSITVTASDVITVAGGGFVGGLGASGAGGTAEGSGKINLSPSVPTASVSATNIQNPGIRFKATDPDGDNLTYKYSIDNSTYNLAGGSAASGAWTAYTTAHGTLSWGTHIAYIKVDDGHGGTNTGTFSFTLSIPTGTIKVTSSDAMTSNFNITGPKAYSGKVTTDNGTVTVATNAPVGSYVIICPAKTGYSITQPAAQNLTGGGTVTFVCTYTANPSNYSIDPRVCRNATGTCTWETTTSPNLLTTKTANVYTIKGASGKPILVGDKFRIFSTLKDTESNIISGSYTGTCSYKKDVSSAFTACNPSAGNIVLDAATGTVNLQFLYAGIFRIRLSVNGGAFTGEATVTVPGIRELK